MQRSMKTVAAGAFLLCSLPACEARVTLHGEVSIDPQLQQGVTEAQPHILYVRAEVPKTGSIEHTVHAICEPTDDVLTVSFFHDGFGCAKQGTVEAWLELAGDDLQNISCGMESFSSVIDTGGEKLASASTVIFAGETDDFGCDSGEDHFQLSLEP